ncbi:glucokinase [Sphingomonas sabuli]|uniref:Glucokinase n=1 Tax=Sphingomonas sabuli TaxID=2764186 RepID=A0A7G9L1S0_9SPHN|nr:glucokinase [Sphingomonas sabuli]QNM82569.1 glucokinase [Sphingomonas sabuli]
MDSGQPPQDWLLVDTTGADDIRFALVAPSDRPHVGAVHSVPLAGLPTFTDALQRFERDSGHPLRGRDCVLAMAGAASGEMISMTRSRWTITRTGLEAVFGKPVRLVNDVAARAWAIRSGLARCDTLRGAGAPSLSKPGRMMMLLVEDGVGAAIVDVSRDGRLRILETECGHVDFAPANNVEEKLSAALRAGAPFVSWERLLTLDAKDPLWASACPEVTELQRGKVIAGILGRFVVNMIHAFGAWQGVVVTGNRASRILSGENRLAFEGQFTARRNFSRLVMAAPVWQVDQREPVLSGAAELLAQRMSERGPGLSRAA